MRSRHGCCHTSLLAVYYRAEPDTLYAYGSYKLLLKTRRQAVQQVSITEISETRPHALGTDSTKGVTYSLTITRGPGGRWTGWATYGPGVRPPECEVTPGGGRVCRFAPTAEIAVGGSFHPLMPFLKQAVEVMDRARLHGPISGNVYVPGA